MKKTQPILNYRLYTVLTILIIGFISPNKILAQFLNSGNNIYYNSGNVGVGTSTPNSLLSLGASVANSKLLLYDGGGQNMYGFGIGSSQLRFHIASPGAKFSFLDGVNGNEIMTLQGNGFLGIGNSSPSSLLSLGTTVANSKLLLYDGGPGSMYGFGIGLNQLRFHIGSAGAKFSFLNSEAGNEIMTLLGTGNLGIGTATPQFKLQVNGQIDAKAISINGVPIGNTGGNSQWTNSGSSIFYNSGNVGIGTNAPSARLSFPDLNNTNVPDGITWYNPAPFDYGIFRSSGTWIAPDYQQLKLSWKTGITLDPGSLYGKSFVEIQGGGLRVTSGNVGIGTLNPSSKLQVAGLVDAQGFTVNGVPLSTGSGNSQWTTNTNNIYYKLGNVGIGTSTPQAPLEITNSNLLGPNIGNSLLLKRISSNNGTNYFMNNLWLERGGGKEWV